MDDTKKFIEELDNVHPVVVKTIHRYWMQVIENADEVFEPTVGVDANSEVLFSWHLSEHYFEVDFMNSGIEVFWEEGTDYGSDKVVDPEQAAEWTVNQFEYLQNE